MIPLSPKKLFRKETKIIVRTVGIFYAIIGSWCLFGLTLQKSMVKDFSENEDFQAFSGIHEILQSIWTKFMPILILIGIGMVIFSYLLDRIHEQQIIIQKSILAICSIWVIAYTVASIPYIRALYSLSPDIPLFKTITHIFTVFGFGMVLAIVTIPNYKILRKMQAEKVDM